LARSIKLADAPATSARQSRAILNPMASPVREPAATQRNPPRGTRGESAARIRSCPPPNQFPHQDPLTIGSLCACACAPVLAERERQRYAACECFSPRSSPSPSRPFVNLFARTLGTSPRNSINRRRRHLEATELPLYKWS
jgi:hypothetical protein